MNWIVIVSLVGAAQGCFIAYLLLAHARQRSANLWLGLYVLSYALLCLGDALSYSSLALQHPDVTGIVDFCVFLLGPFLYQYVRILTGEKSLGTKLWIHGIPALVMAILLVLFHFLPMGVKVEAVKSSQAAHSRLDPIVIIAAIQIFAYLVAALQQLRRYAERLKENYSSLEKLSFLWLRNLLLVNCALWLIWFAGTTTHTPMSALDFIAFPVAAYVLAAFALRAPQVLVASAAAYTPEPATPDAEAEREAAPLASDSADPKSEEKYRKSRLPEAIMNRYQAKLENLMREQKPYLESNLTLVQLAEQLAIPPHHLSQLLNQRLNVTFFDYVNGLRVEQAKTLLRDPAKAHQSILDLAFEAGFNAKSSFNSIFKRTTGHSPSAYRKLSTLPSVSQETQTSSPKGTDDSVNASL